MGSEVKIGRKRDPRLGSRGNGSIEFQNSGTEESGQLGVCFFLFLSSLYFLLLWISAWYKWRRHGFLPPPDRSQVEVEFPSAPNPLKCYRMVLFGRGTS